jgi:hypothetical protein
MTDHFPPLCSEETLAPIFALAGKEPEAAIAAIDAALINFPDDYRLHFLKGSLFVGLKRFVGAHYAMAKAVALAPDFHIARFQLGFFELTSGEPEAAKETWRPIIDALEESHWIRLFVKGLHHLADDRFAECVHSLQTGIAKNTENLPLNTDMALIIARCEQILTNGGAEKSEAQGDLSATSFLLASRTRRH